MTRPDRIGPPSLSIIVAATDSPEAVARTLASLDCRAGIEVIVVATFRTSGNGISLSVPPLPPGEGGRLASHHLLAPPGSGVPRLRRLGLEAAHGRVVAFTEDSCVASADWVEAWSSAFSDPALVAASGLVEHDEAASTLDWAVVFCEYAPFLTPGSTGPPDRLAGNNFAAIRTVVLRESSGEVHESALLAAVRRDGGITWTVAGAVVRHVRRFDLREAIGDRLRFGLEFGRLRADSGSTLARMAGLIAGPAILAAQAGRVAWTMLSNRRHVGKFAESLPLTLGLLATWSVGEWVGWGLGHPRGSGYRRRGTAGRTPSPQPARVGSSPVGCKAGPPAV